MASTRSVLLLLASYHLSGVFVQGISIECNDTNAERTEFAHMAELGYGDEDNIKWLCSGSLISLDYVLTTAHCVDAPSYGSVRWVRLGDVASPSTDDVTVPQQRSVAVATAHPDFNPRANYYDIALLKLEKPAEASKFVRPACIYQGAWPPKGTPLAVTWGKSALSSSPPVEGLRSVSLTLVDQQRCSEVYANSGRKLSKGIVDEQFCAAGHDGQDTCQGDGGGPVQIQAEDNSNPMIIGMTSFGKACGMPDNPGVYTKVSSYLDWIKSIV